jgi:hypothetical protein
MKEFKVVILGYVNAAEGWDNVIWPAGGEFTDSGILNEFSRKNRQC